MNTTKPQISGVELHAIVAELQAFNDSKIVQVYESENSEYFIELYNRTSGKNMLRIIPGKYLYLTAQKPKMESPSGFCMFLRKHLINAIIETFEQIEAQRIVKIIVRRKETSIVKMLASSIGLGGLLAEEICIRANIAKTTEKLSGTQKIELAKEIQSLLKETPKGYIYDRNIIAPVELKSQKLIKTIASFNQALDESLSTSSAQREKLKKEAQYQDKIKTAQHILSEQQKKLKEVESLTDEHKKRGDWFYEHYSEVKTLLTKVQQEKEAHGWQAVQKFLSGLKKIKKIDLKDKQIS